MSFPKADMGLFGVTGQTAPAASVLKNVVLSVEIVPVGSFNSSIVHPREILKPAIIAGAAWIILFHNHPTGDPAPSKVNVEFTKRFARCAELVGIGFVDHVIIGADTYQSLKDSGVF